MKKVFKITLWTILVLIVAMGIWSWVTFGSFVKGAMSVKKLDDGMYYMEYEGDDGFDGLMEKGGGRNAEELKAYVINFMSKGYYTLPAPASDSSSYGCSALTVRTPENGMLMGRNFDFPSATARDYGQK